MADIIFPGESPSSSLGSTWLPKNVDLSIWRGDMQEYVLKFTDSNGAAIPLTGQTPMAVIKQTPGAATGYNFTCTVQNTNEVRLYLPSTVSKTITPGEYVWNFQLTNATGDVRTYLAGDVTVYAEVD